MCKTCKSGHSYKYKKQMESQCKKHNGSCNYLLKTIIRMGISKQIPWQSTTSRSI